MATLSLTIGGVAYTLGSSAYDISNAWTIATPANGPARFSCQAVADAVGNIPQIDQEIILSADGTPIFGGFIGEPRIAGVNGSTSGAVQAEISALDYNSLPARRYLFSVVIPAGTLKAALTAILPYIAGVTLDAAQVDGPTLPALTFSSWTAEQALNHLTQQSGGWVWRINASKVLSMKTPGSVVAPFNLAAGDGNQIGDVTVETIRTTKEYGNAVTVIGNGVYGSATNATEIGLHGQWDLLVNAPDVATTSDANALAASVLSASTILLKQVSYETDIAGVLPGMTQTINLPARGVNNTFLITEVKTKGRGALITYDVTAIEGVVYKTGWREDIKSWGGSSSGNGLTLPGGAGATGATRFAYFLGGSGEAFVRDATPTWVAASPIQVQLNTVARGTIQATVTAQVRALSAGVSVRARLYDYTSAAACPELSAIVTSTSWQTVTWTVTLNAGSHYYGLQLLPGAANEDVGATGYVE